MSLATRCIQCGTVFRVVQDQLKVSEGWVRCGRCDEVFNAIEGLFDLERDAPPDWKPPPAPPAPLAAAVTAAFEVQPEAPEDDEAVFQLSDGDRIHSRFFQPEQADVDHTPAEALSQRDRVDFADARFNTALLVDDSDDAPTGIPRSSVKKARAKTGSPDFVRQAALREKWRTPAARIGLSVSAGVLVLCLLAQMTFHFRDVMAAQWPGSKPWLAQACGVLSCKIEAPRRIDDVAVDSSALSPAEPGTYRLSVALRNRGNLVLAMPWIDLSLTDASGQLVARRALAPTDFRTSPTLAAGSESTLQVKLSSAEKQINGYTVEIFYP